MKSFMKSLAVSLFVAASITVSADNLLPDNNFSKQSGWSFWVEKITEDAGGSVVMQDGKIVAKSPAVSKQVHANIQLIKALDVNAEKKYKVKFKANADKAGKVTVAYLLQNAPYTNYADSMTIAVEPGEKVYECTLDVKKDKDGKYDSPRTLRLWLGEMKDASITLSEVSLEEVK